MDETNEDLMDFIDAYYYKMANKCASRHGRHLLSLSEAEDSVSTDLHDKRELVTIVQEQLQKLYFLKKLTDNVEDLKTFWI